MAMPFSEKIAVAEYFGKKNFFEVSTKVWENVFFESLKKIINLSNKNTFHS